MGISDDELEKLSDTEFAETKSSLTEHVLAELSEQLSNEIQDAVALTDNQKSYLIKAFGIKPKRRS